MVDLATEQRVDHGCNRKWKQETVPRIFGEWELSPRCEYPKNEEKDIKPPEVVVNVSM